MTTKNNIFSVGPRTAMMSFKAEDNHARLAMDMSGISYLYRHTKSEAEAVAQHFGFSASDIMKNMVQSDSDHAPKPEDFVPIPFRLLSASIVAPRTWRATDFGKPGVLKKSLKKIDGKPVYTEHDNRLENWAGLILSPTWSAEATQDGLTIPAGIDGLVAIDSKSKPLLLRAVLSGGVFSNSVTVVFDWEPSHKFDNERDFLNAVGTFVDGTMVRRIATLIHDYWESSLVFLGADPYAKLRNVDGNLMNIDKAQTLSASFSGETEVVQQSYEAEKYFNIPCALEPSVLLLSQKAPVGTKSTVPKVDMKEELLKALRLMLGLGETEAVTAEHIAKLVLPAKDDVVLTREIWTSLIPATTTVDLTKPEEVAKFSLVDRTVVTALEAKVAENTTKIETLTAEALALKTAADYGKKVLEDRRAEAIRLYRASTGEKAVEAVVEMMNTAKDEALTGLIQQYGGSLVEKFTGTCTACGGQDITFQSSQSGGHDTPTKVEGGNFSIESARKRFQEQHNSGFMGHRRIKN